MLKNFWSKLVKKGKKFQKEIKLKKVKRKKTKERKKSTKNNLVKFVKIKESKSISNNFPNRFVKFYHLNQKRLSKERRSTYDQKKKKGICARCKREVVTGIVFCEYHQQKQKGYNRKRHKF